MIRTEKAECEAHESPWCKQTTKEGSYWVTSLMNDIHFLKNSDLPDWELLEYTRSLMFFKKKAPLTAPVTLKKATTNNQICKYSIPLIYFSLNTAVFRPT